MSEQHRRHHPDADLRALLEHAVADVEPAPALERIRARTEKGSPMRSTWIAGIAGAALVTATAVTGVVLLTDDSDPTRATSDPAAAPSDTAPAEPTEGSSEDTSPEPAQTAQVETVPVYWVGDAPAGPRLYREFQQVAAPDGPVLAAVNTALAGEPLDSDYRSAWTGTGVTVDPRETTLGEQSDDTGIVVGLNAGDGWQTRPDEMTASEARLAVQQLVWTATAAAQDDRPITIVVNGSPAGRLLGVDVDGDTASAGIVRGDALATLAPVWIISPQDGDTVSGPLEVEGQGAFFEANVSWQVLDGAGSVVDEGFATAELGNELSPYSFRVTGLAPGDYTLRVYSADMSGGEGGGEPEDTKRFTVE